MNDFGEIQKMIEELAIYENMLDQCHMTVEKLKADYENGPQVIPEYCKPKFYSSIARIDGKVVGYTVSIGKFRSWKGLRVVGKGSWKDREVGKFLVEENFPT